MSTLRAIDLFSGVGGTTLGLKQAGFSVIGAVDLDEASIESYKVNHPEVFLWGEDIRKIGLDRVMKELGLKVGELELLAGCPPCQGYSSIRAKTAKERTKDKRNDLVFEFLRFARGLLPRTLMLENVPGLANDRRMKELESELQELGYKINYKVLSAENYSVPQRRKRLIMIGSIHHKIEFPAPKDAKISVKTAIGDLPIAGKSGDPLHDLLATHKKEVLDIIKMIPKDGGARSDLPLKYQLPCHIKSKGFKDVYGRMKWNDVSPTITGGCTSPSKGRFLHPEENRAITLREAAILQGFPKDYSFPIKRGKQVVSKLIGNAFPPNFTTHHAIAVKEHLLENFK
jgi:DNA (cytosine-5)-methyltransferase 1